MNRKGICRDDTVVIYGDKSNWWAAYALWVFTLVRASAMCGCSTAVGTCGSPMAATPLWTCRPRQTSGYPVVDRDDAAIRAFKEDVLGILGTQPLIDVRSPQEYTGERTHMPDYPEEGALRGGHIPTAQSIPWAKAAQDNGRFRTPRRTRRVVRLPRSRRQDVVYCRIGERSSHTWFVLTHLLGLPGVRNYDGSWTEWGNAVRVPVAVGSNPEGHRARHDFCCPPPWPRWCRISQEVQGQDKLAAAAGVRQRIAAAASRSRRGGDGAGARMPVTAVPACRRGRPRQGAAVLQRARRGADNPRFRGDPGAGLDNQPADDILAVPDDFYSDLGLAALISPLRLRGMSAMLARIKRRLRNS